MELFELFDSIAYHFWCIHEDEMVHACVWVFVCHHEWWWWWSILIVVTKCTQTETHFRLFHGCQQNVVNEIPIYKQNSLFHLASRRLFAFGHRFWLMFGLPVRMPICSNDKQEICIAIIYLYSEIWNIWLNIMQYFDILLYYLVLNEIGIFWHVFFQAFGIFSVLHIHCSFRSCWYITLYIILIHE